MKNKNNTVIYSVIAYACLALAGTGSVILPKELEISTLNAHSPVAPVSIVHNSIMQDVNPGTPNSDSLPVDGLGQYASIISNTLGADGKPTDK